MFDEETFKFPDYYILVSKEKREERLDVCRGCEHLKALNVCGQCGCQMNIKSWIAAAHCPIHKWPVEKI